MKLYNADNYREPAQLDEMVRLEAAGICLFCPEHLDGPGHDRVVYRSDHWSVTPNEFPYAGTRLHLLLVPRQHVDDLCDLSPDAQTDLFVALGWAREHYGITFYGLSARNGDLRYTGGTIYHLHIHLLVGDVDDPDHEPVRVKLSSRPRSTAVATVRSTAGTDDRGEDEIAASG